MILDRPSFSPDVALATVVEVEGSAVNNKEGKMLLGHLSTMRGSHEMNR